MINISISLSKEEMSMMTVKQIQEVLDKCSDSETVVRVKFQPKGNKKIEEFFGCSLKLREKDGGAIPEFSVFSGDHSIVILHINLLESLEIMPQGQISDLVKRAEQILGREFNRKLIFSSGQIVGILNQFLRISQATE